MICNECGKQIPDDSNYCLYCGATVTAGVEQKHMYCGQCGNVLRQQDNYCPKCGLNRNCIPNQFSEKIKSSWAWVKKNSKPIISVSVAVVLLITLFVIISSNQPKNKIIGKWSTERGLDSQIMIFTKNGVVKYSSFDNSRRCKYRFSGSDLIITYDKNETTYKHSTLAKNDDGDYWYIEDDTLYLAGIKYYKQSSSD